MKPSILLVFGARGDEVERVLAGIAHHVRRCGPWDVALDDERRAERDPQWLRTRVCDGVISWRAAPLLVQTCAELALPLVDVSDVPGAGPVTVRPDHVALGHLAAEYFLDRGHRQFGFCGDEASLVAGERGRGFVEALALAGRECDRLHLDFEHPGTPASERAQNLAIMAWLEARAKPLAVLAANDVIALRVAKAAQAAGFAVPDDVSVLGAGNATALCEFADPPLSSVALDAIRVGECAAERLARLLAGGPAEREVCLVEPAGVIARKSTDLLAIDDAGIVRALTFIRDQACRGISVEDVVRQALLSRSQLERRFRRWLGRSPQAEIRRVQVARAAELLRETDQPLKAIADRTGFTHVEYLCVVFKRLTGEAPGRFRRRRAG